MRAAALQMFLLFVGGGAGTLLRFGISLLGMKYFPQWFPLGTLMVNLIGAFCIGVLGALVVSQHLSYPAKLFLMTGLLGGFTTFSSFSLEVVQLWQMHKYSYALLYVLCSNIAGLALCWIGFQWLNK